MPRDIRELLTNAQRRIREIDSQLAALTEERERLGVVVEYLAENCEGTGLDSGTEAGDGEDAARKGPLTGLTIAESAERWLAEVGPPHRDTNALIAGMEAGGFSSGAKNVYTSVYGTLNREVAKEGTNLEKLDGKWGLRSWQQPALDLRQDEAKEEVERVEGKLQVAEMPISDR